MSEVAQDAAKSDTAVVSCDLCGVLDQIKAACSDGIWKTFLSPASGHVFVYRGGTCWEKPFLFLFLILKPFHYIETNWKKAVPLCITLEVTFTLLHIDCVNFSQPSVPPVTLISSGATRTGILATETETPALCVQWERACLLALYVAYA